MKSEPLLGKWRIVSVTRNGMEITDKYDFLKFRIDFKNSGDCEITGIAPYILSDAHSWIRSDSSVKLIGTYTNESIPYHFKRNSETKKLIMDFNLNSGNDYVYEFQNN